MYYYKNISRNQDVHKEQMKKKDEKRKMVMYIKNIDKICKIAQHAQKKNQVKQFQGDSSFG
jgi:hypothetical protein